MIDIAVKAKAVRRGVCPCGYSILRESVPVGAIYLVYPDSVEHLSIHCGGCHKTFPADIIWADDRGVRHWLPLGILELDEGLAV